MNLKTIHITLLTFLFGLGWLPGVTNLLKAQSETDSLRMVIEKKRGEEKLSLQLDLALQIFSEEKDEAIKLSETVLQAAKKSGNNFLQMRAYYTLGRINMGFKTSEISQTFFDSALVLSDLLDDNYYKGELLFRKGVNYHVQSKHLEALESFTESVRACEKANNYRIMGSSNSMMGTIYRVNGLYDRAIEYIIKSRFNYEKAGFIEGYAWADYLLGRIYFDRKNPIKAKEYFNNALLTYSEMANYDGNNNGIAICHEQLGLLEIEERNFYKARSHIEKILEIHTASGLEYGISNAYKILGRIEYYEENYEKAEEILLEALNIKLRIGDKLSLPGIYEYLGLCFIKKDDTKNGLQNLETGLKLAISNKQKKIQFEIYDKLAEAYLNENNLQQVVFFRNKQILLQDSLLSETATIRTDQLQDIYLLDEKNKQIAELQQENEINTLLIRQNRTYQILMIIGILLVTFISTVFALFNSKIRRTNKELAIANAAKDKFFAIIAHDLRGPTQTLTSFLDHIQSEFDDFEKEELKNYIKTLYKSSKNVSDLLENLLVWSRSQVNKIEFSPQNINVVNLIEKSVKSLDHWAKKKQITVTFKGQPELTAFADPNMFQTILRNLLSNAIKFTHRGGFVKVTADKIKSNEIKIVITDTGIGMNNEELSKIFDLSNKHHTPGTENEMSTGLGLILVKDFVGKNKGNIKIESEKNSGTTVSLILPAF